MIHLNVEIDKLDWLKQFDMTSTFSLPVLTVLTYNKWFEPRGADIW